MKIPEEVKKAFEEYLTYDGCSKISIFGGNSLQQCAKEMRMYLVRYENASGKKCSTALMYDPICGVFLGDMFGEYYRWEESGLIKEMFSALEEFCQQPECEEVEKVESLYKIQSDIGTEWESV